MPIQQTSSELLSKTSRRNRESYAINFHQFYRKISQGIPIRLKNRFSLTGNIRKTIRKKYRCRKRALSSQTAFSKTKALMKVMGIFSPTNIFFKKSQSRKDMKTHIIQSNGHIRKVLYSIH